MNVEIRWADEERTERYAYEICRHRWLTTALVEYLVYESAWSWRDLPEHHTVAYRVKVDFPQVGSYVADNISTDRDVFDVSSDAARPVWALQNNPFGESIEPEKVTVEITVRRGRQWAQILELRLDGEVYRPGDTITGRVLLRPFRGPRRTHPIRLPLPDGLPEGRYTISACDARSDLFNSSGKSPTCSILGARRSCSLR
jgi:hypothetical protein